MPAAVRVSNPAADRAPADGPARPLTRPLVASFPAVLTTNPYQRLLYDHLARHGLHVLPEAALDVGWLRASRTRVGFVHFHWPQPHWRHEAGARPLRGPLSWVKLGLFAIRLAVARALGYRIVWTMHQVYPHELASRRLDRLGALVLARASHVLIAHDEATRRTALAELGPVAAKTEVIPHGSYLGVYPPGRPRRVVRAELGISDDAFVFLCFGGVRAYKEVDFLLGAFRSASLERAALVVAGPVGGDAETARIRAAAEADERVKALLDFIPDERVAELYDASDAAVLARGDGGTSGSLVLALSLGLPVLAARADAYTELLGGDEAGWLFEPRDAGSLRRALEAVARTDETALARKREAAFARAHALSWPEIAARTAACLLPSTGRRDAGEPSRSAVVESHGAS